MCHIEIEPVKQKQVDVTEEWADSNVEPEEDFNFDDIPMETPVEEPDLVNA